ncbi:MAG TPA: DMT family transporter [Gemmatimonadota bacterium]|jgi:drug/metabolite transporter (DMT)-like permease
MNEPFFPLPIPRDPESGLAAVLSRLLRRRARTRRPRSGALEARAAAAVGLAALLVVFASAFVGIRFAGRAYPPGALALLRFGVASIALAGILLARRRRIPLPATRDLPGLAASGLFGVTLYHLALNAGERTVNAALASLLINTTPIFAALLASAALRERPRPRTLAGIAIGFAGVAVVSLGGPGGHALDRGALLVLGAALASAIYYVIEKPYLARYPALDVTAWGFWWGTALLLPFAGQLAGALGAAPTSATLAVVYLGLFPAALGYVGWSVVLSRMEVARATTLLYLIPPVAALLGWALLGEGLGLAAALGGAITIAGVALVSAVGTAVPERDRARHVAQRPFRLVPPAAADRALGERALAACAAGRVQAPAVHGHDHGLGFGRGVETPSGPFAAVLAATEPDGDSVGAEAGVFLELVLARRVTSPERIRNDRTLPLRRP